MDEGLLEYDYGFMTAAIPSIVCRIFIDGMGRRGQRAGFSAVYFCPPELRLFLFWPGVLVAESPVIRLFIEEYRFQVAIPEHARALSMVVTDAGDGNRLDMAVWNACGFIV